MIDSIFHILFFNVFMIWSRFIDLSFSFNDKTLAFYNHCLQLLSPDYFVGSDISDICIPKINKQYKVGLSSTVNIFSKLLLGPEGPNS